MDVLNAMDINLITGQLLKPADVAEDDNAVEAVVYKSQQAAKQRCEGFHRSPPVGSVSATRSSDRRPVEIKVGGTEKREERVQGKETAGFVPLLNIEDRLTHPESTDTSAS